MKIEFTAEEVREIILREARKYDSKLNTVRGTNWNSVPSVIVSYEATEEVPAPILHITVDEAAA